MYGHTYSRRITIPATRFITTETLVSFMRGLDRLGSAWMLAFFLLLVFVVFEAEREEKGD